jgi:Gti1/Pac2 family transcription factor
MRRWTDGKSWSASRVSGSFLTYREMEGKRGSTTNFSSSQPQPPATKTPESAGDEPEDGAEGPDGYRYKPDGLMKQSFSITTSQGQHLHLISYYSRSSPTAQVLRQPSQDPSLASIQPAKGMYPDSTVNDQASVPAVTRSPMPGAPNYVVAPNHAYARAPHPHPGYLPPGYIPHPAYMAYPLSPMGTAPPYAIPYQPGLPPLGYHPAYAQHSPVHHLHQAPPSAYDQRPMRGSDGRVSNHSIPPAPYTQSAPPPPVTQSYSQPSYTTASAPAQQEQRQEPQAAIDPRLDPRLTAPPSTESQLQYPQPTTPTTESKPQPAEQPASAYGTGVSVTGSQAPTINALVSGLQDAISSQSQPPPPTNSQSQPQQTPQATTTTHPPSHPSLSQAETTTSTTATTNGTGTANPSSDRDGSVSPGGTKHGAPPQDIPSEKLGFREDQRALSMLDRAFARV